MTARVVVAWVVAAVLGLALAAGITLAASQLSSQRIGLSGEPLSAGDQLVPRAQPRPAQRRPSHSSRPAQPSHPSQASPPSHPPSGDDAGDTRDTGGDD
jgi:hypothetical protein